MEKPTEATKPDFDVYIFKRKEEETDEEPTSNDVGLNCINQTPSLTCLLLDISSQPAEKDDWRKSVTFHTFTKIEDKNCVVIVDSESCINAISSRLCEHLGLGCTPPPPIQSIMDWLHGTRGQTMMSCPSQFQSLQRQYLVWCDSPWMWVKSYYVHHDCSIKMSQFTVNPTCVNLSMRVSRSSYYSWEPRLDSPSRYSLWLCCQLHLSHLSAIVPSLSSTTHTYHVRKPLPPTPSRYSAFESASAFASHKHMHKLHKEISDENKLSNVKPTNVYMIAITFEYK